MVLVYSATCAADGWIWKHIDRWRHVWEQPGKRSGSHSQRYWRNMQAAWCWTIAGTWDLECPHSLASGQTGNNSQREWSATYLTLLAIQLHPSRSGDPTYQMIVSGLGRGNWVYHHHLIKMGYMQCGVGGTCPLPTQVPQYNTMKLHCSELTSSHCLISPVQSNVVQCNVL